MHNRGGKRCSVTHIYLKPKVESVYFKALMKTNMESRFFKFSEFEKHGAHYWDQGQASCS